MAQKIFWLMLMFAVCLIGPSYACSFDVYCDGDECVKSKGALYYVCLEEKADSGHKEEKKIQKMAKNRFLDAGGEKSTIQMLREYLKRKGKRK